MNPTKLNRKAIVLVAAITLALTLGTMTTSAGPSAGKAFSVAVGQAGQAGQDSPLAPVGTGFSYQGSLENGGNPANGQYDFTFKLFDAASGGAQVGSTVTIANQTVTGGLFTVQLDFGAAAFQGDARWLEIAVRTTGGGTYTTLSPRQPLTATPYAASLMPGATIIGTLPGPALSVTNTNAIGVQGTGGISSNGVRGYGGIGVYGITTVHNGVGVRGDSLEGYGLHGSSAGIGTGVRGDSQSGVGVHGNSTGGDGVYGSNAGGGPGVRGESNSGPGVRGEGATIGDGVYGVSTGGDGVHGVSLTNGFGVYGTSSSSIGVFGAASSSSSGVYGVGGIGVRGNASVSNGVGVRGDSSGGYGVHGVSVNASSWGVRGDSTNGGGVAGISTSNTGVYGTSGTGWAGWFDGNVNITGSCCEAAEGTFKIDHPLDPDNKYLVQSAVQSADMMSVYNGNAITDAKGEAVVTLPSYVEALNKDFRYQLTIMGEQFAQARISSKIKNNRFTIKTDQPNIEVSWQVTGIRQDPYAQAHPMVAEVEKSAEELGKYRHPLEYGQPESMGTEYEKMRQIKTPPQESQSIPTPPSR